MVFGKVLRLSNTAAIAVIRARGGVVIMLE